MEIDIRNILNETSTKIRLSDSTTIREMTGNRIRIFDENESEAVILFKKDIDNLILALQKAKELWGDK